MEEKHYFAGEELRGEGDKSPNYGLMGIEADYSTANQNGTETD